MSLRFREKQRGKRWVLIGFILIAIALGLFVGYRLWLQARVQEKLASIKEKDQPVTLEGINAWYSGRNIGSNAASLYLEAFETITSPKPNEPVPLLGGPALPGSAKPFPARMRKATRRYLERNSSALMLLREAREVGQCRYPIDFAVYSVGKDRRWRFA